MVALLFVPLFLLSTSNQASIPNPARSVKFNLGVFGLPSFYINIIEAENRDGKTQQTLKNIHDNKLATYYSNPLNQLQIINIPKESMCDFQIIKVALKHYLSDKENKTIIPFAAFTLSFNEPTTKAKEETVTVRRYITQLDIEMKVKLKELLYSGLIENANTSSLELVFEKFIAAFISKTRRYIGL